MEQPDVTLLQKEIARLHKIIDLLLSQQESSREKSSLKEEEFRIKQMFNSLMEKQQATKQMLYSIQEQTQGTKQILYSHEGKEQGVSNALYSMWELQQAINQALYSLLELRMATSCPTCSPSESLQGTKQIAEPVLPTLHTTEQPTHSLQETPDAAINAARLLPPKIDAASGVVYWLSSLLRHQKHATGAESSSLNAARVLIHIYNKEESSYSSLRKLTSQSEGGLAKLMMRLRKKGLIERKAFQQFELTPTALSLLQDVWAKHH